MTTDRVVLGFVAFTFVVYAIFTAAQIRREKRRNTRAETEHVAALDVLERDARADRDAICEAMQQAAVEAQWTAFIGSLPVLPYDAESLGS